MLAKDEAIARYGGRATRGANGSCRRARRAYERGSGVAEGHAPSPPDPQMISTGVFSPLERFMLRDENESVIEDMRLPNKLARKSELHAPITEPAGHPGDPASHGLVPRPAGRGDQRP